VHTFDRPRALWALALGAALALAVAGCSNSPSTSASHTTTTAAAHVTTTTSKPVSTTTTAPATTTTAAPATTTTAAPATTTTAAAAASAPCTQAAIQAGAGPTNRVLAFGCTGAWAYADAEGGSGPGQFTEVIVLQSTGTAWHLATRAKACNTHEIAPGLYTKGCTTS
jgi:cytoskeletal protein RodZ